MYVIRIDHPVADYAAWKVAFDADPIGREAGGVRQHRILRATDDPTRVTIELEFDDHDRATAFGDALERLWTGPVAGRLGIGRPELRLLEVAETTAYA